MSRRCWSAVLLRPLAAAALLLGWIFVDVAIGQAPAAAVAKGSATAKAGFKNEDEIRDKFNNWRLDADARAWLAAMGYKPEEIESIKAAKPHGEKADVVVRICVNSARGDSNAGLPPSRKDAKE